MPRNCHHPATLPGICHSGRCSLLSTQRNSSARSSLLTASLSGVDERSEGFEHCYYYISVVIQQDVVHLRVLLVGCHIFVIYRPNLKALTRYCFFIKLALPAFAGILLDLDIYSPILRRSSYPHVTICYKNDWGRPYKPSFTGTSTQMPCLHTITTVFFNDLRYS